MEKDTKQETEVKETTPEENEEEYYDDSDNYIIGKVLKGNIKDDPASVRSRPRNTPVSRLTLSDEDKIPKMPEKILPMPLSQEEYDKKRKEFIDRMNKKKESIQKCYDDMRKENLGIKEEKNNNIMNEYKPIKTRKEELKKLIEAEEKKNEEVTKKLNELSDIVKGYDRLKLSTNIKAIEDEIKSIQESLSFGDLSVTEEKNLMDRKATLVAYEKALKDLKTFKEKNKDKFKKTYELKDELKELKKKSEPMIKILNEQFEKKKKEKEEKKNKPKDDNKEETNPVIRQLKLQINILKEEKAKIKEELDAFIVDQTNKWKEYNEQQSLIDYINRAKKKIKDLKMIEKKKEKAQKEREKNGTVDDSEKIPESGREIIKSKPYAKEEADCDYLSSYFSKILPKTEEDKKEEEKKPESHEKSKLDEDLAKGFLKVYKRDETAFGTSGPAPKKKKGKKPKGMKTEEAFVLDFEIVNMINHLKLTPPLKMEEVPKFLKDLEAKKKNLPKEFAEKEQK